MNAPSCVCGLWASPLNSSGLWVFSGLDTSTDELKKLDTNTDYGYTCSDSTNGDEDEYNRWSLEQQRIKVQLLRH